MYLRLFYALNIYLLKTTNRKQLEMLFSNNR